MCGRYTQTSGLAVLKERFGLVPPPGMVVRPRYNLAPAQEAPVVLAGSGRELALLTWGLVPSWSRDRSRAGRMINARAETIAEKPSFRKLLGSRRCLVLADGFYEWRKTPGGPKTPVRFTLESGEPFAFAGLWDSWKDPDGGELRTFTIITTAANALVRPVHDRMPVILRPEHEGAWLSPDPPRLEALLSPYPGSEMAARDASPLVNSPSNDDPACLS